jgi:DNA mismatch repair ATPase MutL
MEQQSAPSESTASEAAQDTRNTNAVPPTQPTSSNPNSNSNASSTTSSTTTTSSSSNTNTNAQPSAQSSTNVDSPHSQSSTMVDLLDISQLRALIDTPAAGLTSHRCPMVRYVFHFMCFPVILRCCVRFQSYLLAYEFIFSFCVSMLTNVNDVAASQHVPVDDVLTNRIQELEAENRELQDKRMFRLAAFVCVSPGRRSCSL